MEESGQVGVLVEESRLGNRGKRVVCPQSEQEVSELLRHADQKGLKVTVSGGEASADSGEGERPTTWKSPCPPVGVWWNTGAGI